jgi:hypothetical protein
VEAFQSISNLLNIELKTYFIFYTIKLNKINNIKVKVIPIIVSGQDISKWRDLKLFSIRYPNIFLLAKKNSGKTSTIFNILKHIITKNTQVLIFSCMINKDPNMIHIVKYLESKNILVISYTSLFEDGINKLKEFYEDLEQKQQESDEKEEQKIISKYILTEEDKSKEKPKKQKEPNYIVIFDNLSAELKNRSIPYFLKRNRYFYYLYILSSQYYYDLAKNT